MFTDTTAMAKCSDPMDAAVLAGLTPAQADAASRDGARGLLFDREPP